MDKRELRIGNYVNIFDVKTKLELFDFSFESDFIFPIEITDKNLLELGFEKINNDYYQTRNLELKLHWTVNKNKMIPEFQEKRLVTGYDFKYVHQLQNLYYSLTNTELEWKEK